MLRTSDRLDVRGSGVKWEKEKGVSDGPGQRQLFQSQGGSHGSNKLRGDEETRRRGCPAPAPEGGDKKSSLANTPTRFTSRFNSLSP